MQLARVAPRVFYRLTDNWIQLAVRFVAPIRGTGELKDAISREILREVRKSKIGRRIGDVRDRRRPEAADRRE